MHSESDFRAVLMVDCGIESTRVVLVDTVGESEYRLIAQRELATTMEPPFSNVTVAIRQAIVELESATGRHLLENDRLRIPQGRDGQGVDAMVATCSAGGGLPMLVVAITTDITADSAVRAIEGTYGVPFDVVTMEQVLREAPLAPASENGAAEPWWRALESLYPGGVLLVGGVEGGNISPLRTLARSLAEAVAPTPTRLEQEVARPPLPVIYAGNSRAQEVVGQYLSDRLDLHVVDNVRPSLRHENLLPTRQEAERLYEKMVLQQVPGYDELTSWLQSPVQLPYMGLQLAVRFLAMHHQREVLAFDLGSGSTVAAWANKETCARVVLGHLGMGYGVARVLSQRGAERIRRWLPFPATEEDIRTWVLNRALRPRTRPATEREMLMQQALAREVLAEAMIRFSRRQVSSYEMVVASGGGLARLPRMGQVVQILLDALEVDGRNPAGLVDLYLDRSCLLPSTGALATLNPDAAACVLLRDGLFHLGPCLVPLGKSRPGTRALTVEVEYPDGVREQVEVPWGKIQYIPFRFGEEAHLSVSPARGVSVGYGRSGEMLTTKEGEMIAGGRLGLIVDARGRPLPVPEEDELRQQMLREWLGQSGACTAEEMERLIPPPEPEPEPEAPVEPVAEPDGKE